MEKLIKENWFKLGLFLLALIGISSLAYCYILFLPFQLRNQEINRLTVECRNLGEKIEKEINPPNIGIRPAVPEFYYNPKLKKCFYCGGQDGQPEESRIIIDVYTNKTLASYNSPVDKSGYTPEERTDFYQSKTDFAKDKAKLFEQSTFVSQHEKLWLKKLNEAFKANAGK